MRVEAGSQQKSIVNKFKEFEHYSRGTELIEASS